MVLVISRLGISADRLDVDSLTERVRQRCGLSVDVERVTEVRRVYADGAAAEWQMEDIYVHFENGALVVLGTRSDRELCIDNFGRFDYFEWVVIEALVELGATFRRPIPSEVRQSWHAFSQAGWWRRCWRWRHDIRRWYPPDTPG